MGYYIDYLRLAYFVAEAHKTPLALKTRGTIAMAHAYNGVDWVAFAQDCRLYLTKEEPCTSGRRLGAPPITTFKSAAERQLPSVAALVDNRPLIEDDGYGTRNMAAILSEALSQGQFEAPISPVDISISPASHDNTQLRWGRPHVPCCANGAECVANLIEGAPRAAWNLLEHGGAARSVRQVPILNIAALHPVYSTSVRPGQSGR